MSQRKPRLPRNDQTIIHLLAEGRIKVEEDSDDLVLDAETGELRPRTKIYVRDLRIRNREVWREQVMKPKFHSGHPYFNIWDSGRKGRIVWLSARRVVWYAFNRERTGLMVCVKDGNPWNFNIWNLILRDQNDQNAENRYKKEFPERYGRTFRDSTVPLDEPADDNPF